MLNFQLFFSLCLIFFFLFSNSFLSLFHGYGWLLSFSIFLVTCSFFYFVSCQYEFCILVHEFRCYDNFGLVVHNLFICFFSTLNHIFINTFSRYELQFRMHHYFSIHCLDPITYFILTIIKSKIQLKKIV
jgi:hypothetical protein